MTENYDPPQKNSLVCLPLHGEVVQRLGLRTIRLIKDF